MPLTFMIPLVTLIIGAMLLIVGFKKRNTMLKVLSVLAMVFAIGMFILVLVALGSM